MTTDAEIFALALGLARESRDEAAMTRTVVAEAHGRPAVLRAAHAHARALARGLPEDSDVAVAERVLAAAARRAGEHPGGGDERPVLDLEESGPASGGASPGPPARDDADVDVAALARKALSDLARGR